jgi:hypothetical protein
MAKQMNAMISLGISGVFQVRSRSFLDEAGELPFLETSTQTNSTVSGNQRHFCSFQVRLYFRARMHTHRTIMKALSSDAEKRKVSSIIMVMPSLSKGATPSCSHNCVHSYDEFSSRQSGDERPSSTMPDGLISRLAAVESFGFVLAIFVE